MSANPPFLHTDPKVRDKGLGMIARFIDELEAMEK